MKTDERHDHLEALRRRHKGIGRKPREQQATAERTDGLGNPLVADALYFVQDSRAVVGNCGLWWAKDRKGYCCSIDDAGRYTGEDVETMRGTDVPWPVDYVEQHVVRHVRVDGAAFSLTNYKPGRR